MFFTKLLNILTFGLLSKSRSSSRSISGSLSDIFDTTTNSLSSSSTSWIEIVGVIALTIIIAYLVGLMISQIVDRKLGEIEIRMPQIKVPTPTVTPQFVVQVAEDSEGKIKLTPGGGTSGVTLDGKCMDVHSLKNRKKRNIETFESDVKRKLDPTNVDDHPNRIGKSEPFLNVRFDEDDVIVDDVNRDTRYVKDLDTGETVKQITVDELDYPIVVDVTKQPTETRPKVGCTKDSDCNVVNGGGRNVCKSDGTCHCISGSGTFCQYGPTNFRDPVDMTPEERERFKSKYRNNMTLQDYKNWLLLYKGEIENLREYHRRNLLKLLRGGVLSEADIPAVRLKPPTSAADYFQKMYKGGKISVHFPDNDSPLVGSNYNKYTDFVPPENTASSWITGVVDLYKEAGKDDAKAIDYYLRPETTIGEEEMRVGEVYQKYLHKHHNVADLRKLAERIERLRPQDKYIPRDISLKTFRSQDPNVGQPD